MDGMLWIGVLGAAVALGVIAAAGWACVEIVRRLREIVVELRHIRRHLQEVNAEIGKVSAPLADVKTLYGLGERLLGRDPRGERGERG